MKAYLKRELEMFDEVQYDYRLAIIQLLELARDRFEERSQEVDHTTPIHHRVTPGDMVTELKTKARRLQNLIDIEGWETNLAILKKILDEAKDEVVYAAMLGGLALLLLDDLAEEE